MELIIQYLESKISDEVFFEKLYQDNNLQNMLDKEVDIPPYTNSGSLLLYLLSGDNKDLRFIVNAKDALKQVLEKYSIKFDQSNKDNEIYNLILEIQPKWVDVYPEYFSDIIKKYDGKNKQEIKQEMKEKIHDNFLFIKNKPKWLQNPNWPIEDGKPLTFIGELDMGNLLHDTATVYVFYNDKNKTFKCIKQNL